jgi:light-regulated signal transduction histidine kinase (bacteriophytochrome)
MTFQVDLTNCDREPIHIPGSIQPHGAMLICEGMPLRVFAASANCVSVLNLGAEPVGAELEQVLGAEVAHRVINAAAKSMSPSSPGLLFHLAVPGVSGAFDVAAHTYQGRTFIEFQPAEADSDGYGPIEVTRALVRRLADEPNMDRLARSAVRLARMVLGYDRVMIYKLLHNGAGRVMAEDRRTDLNSFLGQHFPASDIPVQARELYKRNWIRMISDVNYAPSPVLPPVKASEDPIDMSYAQLRSVSPIHCEYLRNMGVSASMSVSLMVDGELWGLIACHHYAPKVVSLPHRVGAELFGQFISMQIEAMERRGKFEVAELARQRLDAIVATLPPEQELKESLRTRLAELAELIECDGAGMILDGEWITFGTTPTEDDARKLAEHLNDNTGGALWTTTRLDAVVPEPTNAAGVIAGVLSVPITFKPRDYLFYFRSEESRHIDWAGDPEKPIETGPLGDRLTPRKSFELWREEVRGQSTPWAPADIAIAEAVQTYLRDVVLLHTEATADERRRADARRKVVNEELNHRVKNILALTRSIVAQSKAGAANIEDFTTAVNGRLSALAFAHDHVTRDRDGGDVRTLLESEFAAYIGHRDAGRIRLDGPDVRMDSRAFSSFALVAHELATNAAKYGSLKDGHGAIDVKWSTSTGGDFLLEWKESGTRIVAKPERRGFGSRLISDVIPYDLGGTARMEFEPDGLRASFQIPARFVTRVSRDEVRPRKSAAPASGEGRPLAGRRMLLVEDQMLIAMDAENHLRELGAENVRVAASVADALAEIARRAPDAAVLDINLGDGTSAGVAEALGKLGTPYIFASGYQEADMIPAAFRTVPLVRKPYSRDDLAAALARAMQG